MASDLEFRIGAELSEIKGALASLKSDFQAVSKVAGEAFGGAATTGANAAEKALERERIAAQKLAEELRHQSAAYGQARSRVLELNRARDLSKIKTEAERRAVSQAYDELIRKTRQAEQEQSRLAGSINRGFSRAAAAVGAFVSVYSAIRAVRGLATVTDEFARLNAQLKLNTDSQEELATAQREVYRIAQQTRAPIDDVANTYAILERSTKRLGTSQEQIVRVLETVNKSIALTPVSAETARASLVQFGQALSGDFKAGAQELNSILEQTPGLATAVADGLGVAAADLKAMGEAGELSAERVFFALLKVSEQVDEQFREIPLTIGGALTQLRNDLVMSFGAADVSPITDAIGELRDTLTDPATQEGLITLAEGLITLTATAAEAASELGGLGTIIGESFARFTGASSPLDDLEAQIRDVDRALNNSVMGKPIKFLFTSDEELKALREQLVAEKAALEEMLTGTSGSRETPEQRTERLRKEAEARQRLAEMARKERQEKEELERQAEARQRNIEKMIASLTEEAATYGKSAEEVIRYRLAALGASEAEIERAVELTRTIEALKEKEKAEKEAAQAAKERARVEQQLARQLEDVQIRLLEAGGDTVEAARRRLEAQFRDLIAGLEQAGNTAGAAAVRKLIDTEVSRAQFDEIKRQFDQTVNELQARQQSLANQVSLGALPAATAQQQEQAAREQARQQLEGLVAQMQALAQATNDPQIVAGADAATAALQRLALEGATGLDAAIIDLRASLANMQRTLAQSVVNAGVNALDQFFMDLVENTKSGSEALRNFARNFALSMAQIASRALATFLVLRTLDAIYPGLGQITAASMGATVNHGGGMAGTGPRRQVSPLLFAGAPRYHSGGMVGLRPDERPAILQTGEEVLSRQDPRNAANGGGGYRIVNVVDPSMAGEYLESAAGERAVLNIISRNPGAVREAVK